MKQLIIPLSEEQQALIKLTVSSIDAKAAKPICEALDAVDSVKIDLNELESDGDPNQIVIALGLLAIGQVGKMLNI